jgi:type III secretion protein HrpB1
VAKHDASRDPLVAAGRVAQCKWTHHANRLFLLLCETSMPTIQCSATVLDAFLSVFSGGMRIGAQADLDDMLLALRTWQPDSPLADVLEARLHISRTDWREAAQLLRQVSDRYAGLPIVSALHGLCLFMLRDDEWRRLGAQVLESGNQTAIAIVGRFLGVTIEPGAHPSLLAERVTEAVHA